MKEIEVQAELAEREEVLWNQKTQLEVEIVRLRTKANEERGRLLTKKEVIVEAIKQTLERVVKTYKSQIQNYEIEVQPATTTIKRLKKEKQEAVVKAEMGAQRIKVIMVKRNEGMGGPSGKTVGV